jgi:hypothetical protein
VACSGWYIVAVWGAVLALAVALIAVWTKMPSKAIVTPQALEVGLASTCPVAFDPRAARSGTDAGTIALVVACWPPGVRVLAVIAVVAGEPLLARTRLAVPIAGDAAVACAELATGALLLAVLPEMGVGGAALALAVASDTVVAHTVVWVAPDGFAGGALWTEVAGGTLVAVRASPALLAHALALPVAANAVVTGTMRRARARLVTARSEDARLALFTVVASPADVAAADLANAFASLARVADAVLASAGVGTTRAEMRVVTSVAVAGGAGGPVGCTRTRLAVAGVAVLAVGAVVTVPVDAGAIVLARRTPFVNCAYSAVFSKVSRVTGAGSAVTQPVWATRAVALPMFAIALVTVGYRAMITVLVTVVLVASVRCTVSSSRFSALLNVEVVARSVLANSLSRGVLWFVSVDV